ncbi:hypothetical protein F5Y07DRAFT_23246 [Xylaria sp. FL0933]|nr:hypothetical protein F5Y07DRAFT_23246 [Xylaria sp. FL0933]
MDGRMRVSLYYHIIIVVHLVSWDGEWVKWEEVNSCRWMDRFSMHGSVYLLLLLFSKLFKVLTGSAFLLWFMVWLVVLGVVVCEWTNRGMSRCM